MVEKIRKALRITTLALDEDIEDAINACKRELHIAGVGRIEETDPLIVAAIKTYCRAEFDYCGKGEQYRKSFEALKIALSLSGDYDAE